MKYEERSICIDCGLCCDGTMFHAVDLEPSDDVLLLRERGAVLVTDSVSRRFQQPCVAFDGSCCTVYESRPTNCRTYVCALLTSVNNGDTSVADAQVVIRRARELSAIVRDCLDPAVESDVIRLGRHGLSTYLGIMNNQYEHDRLEAAFPEAAELIVLLRETFGWTNRVAADSRTSSVEVRHLPSSKGAARSTPSF